MGTNETTGDMPAGPYVEAVQKLADTLDEAGADNQFVIEEGAEHNKVA